MQVFAKKAKKNDVDEQIEVIKSIKKKKESSIKKKIVVIGDDPFLHERKAESCCNPQKEEKTNMQALFLVPSPILLPI